MADAASVRVEIAHGASLLVGENSGLMMPSCPITNVLLNNSKVASASKVFPYLLPVFETLLKRLSWYALAN
ncbi:hypothetical protein [Paenibacillus motobuensis]|uniref:Uncharacterized protein n=1 Tax=Paenibacillus motobuensis TaxID=295324 RepID=A0ABP3ILL5_9BACL